MIEQLLQFRSIIEITVLTVLFYIALNSVRGTSGAGILKGIVFLFIFAFLGVMYVSDLIGLIHIRAMLKWLLYSSPIALLIIFHPELRRQLARFSQSRLLSPLLRVQPSRVVTELTNAAVKLAKAHIGALIVIERDVGLGEYIEGRVRLNAAISSELLEAIFYPGSALHDGAVIIQNDLVAAAACFLPLADDPTLSKSMGTRHRAAIGITEETDAVALVVSEETGHISITVAGKLTPNLEREPLERLLSDLYARRDRPSGKRKEEKS